MQIRIATIIDSPAADAWHVLGPRYADAAEWASTISQSRAVGASTVQGAPCDGRECHVSVPGADRLVEKLVAYDEDAMSITYQLASGMQRFARSATNTWSLRPLAADRCELTMIAEFDLTPTGRILAAVLRPYLASSLRHATDDFRVFVETGMPSDRKRRSQTGTAALTHALTGNAVFTAACGAALTMASAWWARQFGGPVEPVITALGTGLLAYAGLLAWVSGNLPTPRAGRVFAMMDAGWVAGTVVLLALAGPAFTVTGFATAAAVGAVVALFGWAQWRAASRIRPMRGRVSSARAISEHGPQAASDQAFAS